MDNALLSLYFFIFGASLGSFLNVLADRLPHNKSIMGRSMCDYCGKKIAWFDLFPIISFFLLKGRCRYCHKKLSFQYPTVEITTGVSFMLIFLFAHFNNYVELVAFLGIFSSLLVIFISDVKYHLISDYLLISLTAFSLLLNFSSTGDLIYVIKESIISALIVSLPIFLIYFISHEKAMGLGDVYLTAIMGLLLGWQAGYMALYIAFVTGAIIGVYLMMRHKKRIKSRMPFGPFLVVGTIVMLFYGGPILDFIKGLYGL